MHTGSKCTAVPKDKSLCVAAESRETSCIFDRHDLLPSTYPDCQSKVNMNP